MQKRLHVFSFPTYFLSFFPSSKLLTMNNSTTPRRWALAVMTLLCLLAAQMAHAQCNDFITAPLPANAPVDINLNLTQNGGTEVELNQSVLTAFGFVIDGACDYEFDTDPSFTSGNFTTTSLLFDCSDVQTSPQIWYVRVNGPSTNFRELHISIFDNTLPMVACPASLTVNTAAGFCSETVGGIAAFTSDNCPNETTAWTAPGATPAFAANDDASGTLFPKGTTTVTYAVTDASGTNTVTCAFTVTVEDNEAPVITACPGNLMANTDDDAAGNCATTVSGTGITATDNCPGFTISYTLAGATVGAGSGLVPAAQLFSASGTGITTVTYTVSDGTNTDMCSFDVEVNDTEFPTINCPVGATLYLDPLTCDVTISGTQFDPTATPADNCGLLTWGVNMPGAIAGVTTLDGVTLGYGTTVIEWGATDNSLNESTCSLTIVVSDNTAPVVAAYAPVYNVNVTPGDCSKFFTVSQPIDGDPAYTDCNPVTITRGDAIVNDSVDAGLLFAFPAYDPFAAAPNNLSLQFPVGETKIPYIWTDVDGNADTLYVTVNVIENEKPVAKCKPGPITIALAANGLAVVNPNDINNGSIDNCGIKSLAVSPTSFDCTGLPGTPSVTLTVTDDAGNTHTCTTTVDVVDNLAPTVNCPTNQNIPALASCQTPASAISALALTLLNANAPLTAPGQYKDNSYNTLLGCNTAPTVTYSLSGANFTGPANGSGSVPGSVNFKAGTTPVTYTFSDGVNSSVCSFNVSVSDLTAPTFSPCPSNTVTVADDTIFVNANLGGCTASATWPAIIASDECTLTPSIIVSQSHTSGGFFNFGNTKVTYTATDLAGNIGTCTFIVKVRDTQAPTAKCKNITAYLDAAGQASKVPADIDDNSTDNCFYNYAAPLSYSFFCGLTGPQTVTLTVRDGSGNTATCTATVTVLDTIKPVANCALINFVDLDSLNGAATVLATTLNNGSTDNCPLGLTNLAISRDGLGFGSSVSFGCADKAPQVPNQIITLRVTDASGNVATCSRTVVVRDVTRPAFTLPPNITVSCSDDQTSASTGVPTNIFDKCGPTFITQSSSITAGTCPNEYTIARTWTVSDGSGNSRSRTQLIVVEDNEPPLFNFPTLFEGATDQINFCDGPLIVEIDPNAGDVEDNGCSGGLIISYRVNYPTPSYGYTDVTTPVVGTVVGNYFPIGTTEITFYAQDLCGNVDSLLVEVVIADTMPPLIEQTYQADFCDRAFVIPNTPGACSNSFSWTRPNFQAGIIDDCSSVLGQNALTVTETISDAALSSTLNQSIPFNFYLPATFNNFNRIFPTAQFPVGVTTVTYTATDNVGNQSVCKFTVEVTDTQVPKPTCPNTQTLAATCPTAVLPDYRNLVLVSDNCPSNVTLTQSPTAGSTLGSIFSPNLPASGDSIVITITAAELYNDSTCTFKVKLIDGQAPVPTAASLPDLVSYCGSLNVPAPTATDPCNPNSGIIYGTPSTQVQQLPGSNPPVYTFGVGQYAVNWQYKDPSNNISFQPQTIKVFADVFPPLAKCKASSSTTPLLVDLDATGSAKITPAFVDNGSADTTLCNGMLGSVSLLLNDSTFNCADLATNMGKQVVTLQVKDVNGNTATCSATVQVRDVTKPVLGPIPASVTVEACANIPNPAIVTATDQCPTLGAAATVVRDSVTTKTATGIGQYNYTITRRWTATDGSGNTSTGTQVITVKDTKAPVFAANAPSMVMVSTDVNNTDCKAAVKYKVSQYVTDCAKGVDLRVTSSPAGFSLTDSTEVLPVGSHTYVFTAKDTTGNISRDTVVFVVKDATLPTAVCINGVSAALQGSGTVVVTVNQFNNNSYDNCGLLVDSMKIQRLTAAGVGIGVPTKTLMFNCADADNVTQHRVRLTVRDLAGNESTCQTYIVIQDNVKPAITSCPPSKTVQCSDNLAPSVQGTPTATDNCTVQTPTFQDSLKAGAGNICQVLQRTWRVLDQANNSSTCIQTFSIQDTIKPTFSVLPASATRSCEDPLIAIPTVTATDNCDNMVAVTFKEDTINIAPGACGKFSFTKKRTWTATDDCGNTRVHTQNITVTDVKAPQFIGLPDTLRFFSANFPANTNCTVPVKIELGQYLNDCTADTSIVATHNLTSFAANGSNIMGNFPVANYQLIITATDLCNNVGKDTVQLRVIDNSKPTLVCNNNLVVALGTGSTAKISPIDIDLGSTDNCAIASRVLSDSTFNCADVGDQTITMTATDVNGNTNVCTVVVKVTLGNNPGLVVTTINGTESFFGGKDGTVSASTTGGSGTYTYQWSPNANNATTATVANLPAGTYTVTVTDAQTQCKGTATATVAPGPKVTFKVGQGAGAQNAVIEVPVTVENFTKIYSFSFSYQSVNNLVGTVTGTSATAAALSAGGTFTSNASGVTWVTTGAPLTLPANTVIFNIQVQLTGAPIGSTSVVRIFDGTPSLEVQQDSAGTPKVTMVSLTDGLATINAGSADLKIGGDIQTWRIPVKPVPGVNVALTGGVTANQVTPAAGTYLFNVATGTNTVVACTKSTAGNQGITAADLLLIQNHIFGSQFASPYQWVAANVNNSGGANPVTLADYLLIQRVVLGTDQNIQGSPDWKFIPKSYVFPTPNPLSVPFPQTIEHTPAAQDFIDDDFVAVRMGDVNGNVTPSAGPEENEDRSGETFRFRLDERKFRSGEVFQVPFRASDFTERQAYQMTIEFDPTVFALEDIEAGVLPNLNDNNFGTARLSEGYLSTVWVGRDPLTLRDDEVLFTLTFRALRDGKALAEVLRPGSQVTAAEAYDRMGKTMKVDFEFVQSAGNEGADFALYQNQPNPFQQGTTIGFRLPETARATLRVYNSAGQMVRMVVGEFAKGYNEVRFEQSDLGTPGVYWYELESADRSDRKKMVLID